MSAGAILGGASIGAGVGVSSVALAPFNAANTFMGSAFFGYGMILGERYMYQADWPKIQARLEHGEKIENIIQEYTGVFTAVVMKEAKIIFDTVTREFIRIMQEALSGSLPTGPKIREDAPTIGDPRRPRSPGVPAPAPTIPTTPDTIIKEAFEKTGTITAPVFIPPIYSTRNPVAPQSIARVSHAGTSALFSIQQTKGKWTTFKIYSSFTAAFTAMMLAYPSPKYFPVYVGTTVFATRRQ